MTVVELRGAEFSLEQVRKYAGPEVTYVILRPGVAEDSHLALIDAAGIYYGRACTCGSGVYWAECPVLAESCG